MAEINASGRAAGLALVIACPRCKRANSMEERRCTSCGLPLDAAVRAQSRPEAEAAGDDRGTRDSDAQAQVLDAQHEALAGVLGIEIEHVRALADAGIHTLEHVAESIPERIGRALAAWTHLEPAALVARARQVLHREPPDAEPPPKPPPPESDAVQWWKVT